MASLVFSRRLGLISSHSMLVETSTAITMSTPTLFVIRVFDPNLGLDKVITNKTNMMETRIYLNIHLDKEISGISMEILLAEKYFFTLRFLQKYRSITRNAINTNPVSAQNIYGLENLSM